MASVSTLESEAVAVIPIDSLPVSPSAQARDAAYTLASHIMLYSFAAAVLLAIGGFVVVAIYLFQYLHHSFDSFNTASLASLAQFTGNDPGANSDAAETSLTKLQDVLLARAGIWKFVLQSCGIMAGAAFGFLGFALFLLGAKGDMDASFKDSSHQVQLSRMAPGSFVILIAAILVGICSLNKVDLAFNPDTTETKTVTPGAAVSAPSQPQSFKDPADDPFALPPDPVASAPATPAGSPAKSKRPATVPRSPSQ